MKSSSIFLSILFSTVLFFAPGTAAQCDSPDLVHGADKYNALVCKAEAAAQNHDEKKALSILLLAEEESPLPDFPNLFLFDRVALSNARLGNFDMAELNLAYADISLLWMKGIARCRKIPSSDDEILVQDDAPLHSENARYMANVLCGDAYDKAHEENLATAGNSQLTARMALRHAEIKNEIDGLYKSCCKAPVKK